MREEETKRKEITVVYEIKKQWSKRIQKCEEKREGSVLSTRGV
jgi:hypothetical protein